MEKIWKEVDVACFKGIFQQMSEATKESHRKDQSGWPVPGPQFDGVLTTRHQRSVQQ